MFSTQQPSNTQPSDTGAKKNLIKKKFDCFSPKYCKEIKFSQQQKKMAYHDTEINQLDILLPPTPKKVIRIKKKGRKKLKLRIKKKAQKIEVDFQENKVDKKANQQTENEQKMGRPAGRKNKKTVRNEAVKSCVDAMIERLERVEIEDQLIQDLEELNNIPEVAEVPEVKVKKKRVSNPMRYLTRNRCEANVWAFGTKFGRCSACCSDDGSGLCKTHSKVTAKIQSKANVGKFYTATKADVHGLSTHFWSCLPCAEKDGIQIYSEDHRFKMDDYEELGLDEGFVPWMQGAKTEAGKGWLKEQKRIFKLAMKDFREGMLKAYDEDPEGFEIQNC